MPVKAKRHKASLMSTQNFTVLGISLTVLGFKFKKFRYNGG